MFYVKTGPSIYFLYIFFTLSAKNCTVVLIRWRDDIQVNLYAIQIGWFTKKVEYLHW